MLLPTRKRAVIDAARAREPQREAASRVPLRFNLSRTNIVTEVFLQSHVTPCHLFLQGSKVEFQPKLIPSRPLLLESFVRKLISEVLTFNLFLNRIVMWRSRKKEMKITKMETRFIFCVI